MATDATNTPSTNFSIPKYLTSADAPSGKGFNAAIDFIDTLLKKGFTILTTTGDMPYASAANVTSRLPIGSTNQVLTVAGGVPSWATLTSGYPFSSRTSSIAGLYISAAQSVPNASSQAILLDTFSFNTDGYGLSSNQLVVPRTGYYRFTASAIWAANATGIREIYVNKTNTVRTAVAQLAICDNMAVSSGSHSMTVTGIINLAVNEGLQLVGSQTSGGALNFSPGGVTFLNLTAEYLGA